MRAVVGRVDRTIFSGRQTMKPSPSSNQDLAQIALTSDDESGAYWDPVRELQKRGTRAVFDMAAQLCAGEEPRSRSVGLDVLAQLGYKNGRPFLAESLPIALRLARDSETTVRRSALSALGHLGDAKALPELLDHITHNRPKCLQVRLKPCFVQSVFEA
jgi:HEAT repeat protein